MFDVTAMARVVGVIVPAMVLVSFGFIKHVVFESGDETFILAYKASFVLVVGMFVLGVYRLARR